MSGSRPDRNEVIGSITRRRGYSRRGMIGRTVAAGVSLQAGLAWGVTTHANAQEPEPSGKVILAMPAEPDSLHNWRATNDAHPIVRNIQEALVNRDPVTNELVGELATSWEQTDESTWRFHLREGVTFHDGEPFQAEAAAFGINYTWSPENAFQIIQFIGPNMEASVVDDYTIDIVTESPDPILPSRLYFSPIPSMRQVQDDPDSLADNPIGTGPYVFREWNRGQNILIEANPDWWGHTSEDAYGQVTIAEAEFVFRDESAVRAAMVSTGEAQFARFLSPEDVESAPQSVTSPSVETIFLRLDTMHPAMSDVRIRQAIAEAADKNAIAEQLFGGADLASQLVGPSAVGYNAELEPYPYDLDHARQLVEEAAADGVAVDAPITVVVRQGSFVRNDEMSEYLANQLNEIGLNASVEILEVGQFNEQFDTNFHDVPEDRGWIAAHAHGNEIMDVSGTAQAYYACDGNSSTFCDPELDTALETALPLTGEDRQTALAEVTRMYYEGYGAIPILHMPLHYGLAENLTWEPRLDGFVLLKEMALNP